MSDAARPWWNRRRPTGFRLSPGDAIVLQAGAVATVGLWAVDDDVAWIFPVVLGHFFLFCNIFRVGALAEYVWAGVFIVNVTICLIFGQWNWPVVLAVQCPVTLGVIIRALASEDYHGLGYSILQRRRRQHAESES